MIRFLAIAVMTIGLTACYGTSLQNVQGQNASKSVSPYHAALFSQYLTLSEMEYAEGDYRDSDAFAIKAMATNNTGRVGPDTVSSRKIPTENQTEMRTVQENLTYLLDQDGAEIAPVKMAEAVSHFDCWLQEQEENFQPQDIAKCRRMTLNAMDDVIAALKVANTPASETHIVFFDYNRADLREGAPTIVETVANLMQEHPSYNAYLYAHADAPGGINYNQSLSERRAEVVSKALQMSGVEASRITAQAFGESKPMVETAKGARELKNRRVEIILSAE